MHRWMDVYELYVCVWHACLSYNILSETERGCSGISQNRSERSRFRVYWEFSNSSSNELSTLWLTLLQEQRGLGLRKHKIHSRHQEW